MDLLEIPLFTLVMYSRASKSTSRKKITDGREDRRIIKRKKIMRKTEPQNKTLILVLDMVISYVLLGAPHPEPQDRGLDSGPHLFRALQQAAQKLNYC